MAAMISIYNGAKDTKSTETIAIDLFLESVKNGRWQDIVLPIRAIGDKEIRNEAKKKAIAVTISGAFKERKDEAIEKHSGYIGIDIDEITNFNAQRRILQSDKYVYALFASISGRGLCAIFKIAPAKHRDSFNGISEYLFKNYNIIIDPTSVNQSRARFVSYDPELYINPYAEKFTQYPTAKPPRKIENVVFLDDDFKSILSQITANRINLCDNYHEWLRIGFSFVHQFNESGREYFHLVSQYSIKYDSAICDKQYDAMIRHRASNIVTIATFYYYAKSAGIEIHSPRTRKIIQAAKQGKAAALSPSQIATNLKKFEDIDIDAEKIEAINKSSANPSDQLDIVSQMEMFIRGNYDLKRNYITQYIEDSGKKQEAIQVNSIFLKMKKVIQKAEERLFKLLLNSDFIQEYNPLLDFFEQNKHHNSTGHIKKLISSIKTIDSAHAEYFFTKWIVGVIASIHGHHSPFIVILYSKQVTGKTEFWRRLWTKELKSYYAEVSSGMKDTDFEILMSQKIVVMDDECGNKSKKDVEHQKSISSKEEFTLRKPYGEGNVTLPRLAMLCGTTNEDDILKDLTGNSRYIIIDFQGYDWEIYNSVDKTALLMEAYNLYKSGFEYERKSSELDYLNKYDYLYMAPTSACELLQKYFAPTTEEKGTPMTATDFAVYFEAETRQKINTKILGMELKRLGYKQVKDKKGSRVYYCYPLSTSQTTSQLLVGIEPKHFPDLSEDLPF